MGSTTPAVTTAVFLAAGLLLSSCVTTEEFKEEPLPESLELIAALEQTREISLENKLTYPLSRLFGIDNVAVVVSSRAHYGSIEEGETMQETDRENRTAEREFRRCTGPGEVARSTVAVLINATALTQEQQRDLEKLREQVRQLVIDGAGLRVEGESPDSVSVLFVPFAD